MTVLDSPLSKSVQATYCLGVGDFHFFNNFVVAEFKQGVYVSYNDFKEIFELAQEFYGTNPVGFISNRVNSFSINLLDAIKYRQKANSFSGYAIVTYNHNTRRILAIEDYYFNIKRKRFNSLVDAAEWVNKKVTKATKKLQNKSN